MSDIRIDDIWYAISALKSAAERAGWDAKGWQQHERAQSMARTARDAEREFDKLSRIWSDFKSYERQRGSEYDRYVTREPEGCSCHISPPCSFCTREADEDQAA